MYKFITSFTTLPSSLKTYVNQYLEMHIIQPLLTSPDDSLNNFYILLQLMNCKECAWVVSIPDNAHQPTIPDCLGYIGLAHPECFPRPAAFFLRILMHQDNRILGAYAFQRPFYRLYHRQIKLHALTYIWERLKLNTYKGKVENLKEQLEISRLCQKGPYFCLKSKTLATVISFIFVSSIAVLLTTLIAQHPHWFLHTFIDNFNHWLSWLSAIGLPSLTALFTYIIAYRMNLFVKYYYESEKQEGIDALIQQVPAARTLFTPPPPNILSTTMVNRQDFEMNLNDTLSISTKI